MGNEYRDGKRDVCEVLAFDVQVNLCLPIQPSGEKECSLMFGICECGVCVAVCGCNATLTESGCMWGLHRSFHLIWILGYR